MKCKLSGLFIIILFFSCVEAADKVVINNTKENEKIYLKRYIDFDHEMLVLSLSNSYSNDSSKEYRSQSDCFLYKFENDTLFIYHDWDERDFKIQKFKTKIKYLNLNYIEEKDLYKNYKKKGFDVFPASRAYIIENKYK